MKLVLPYVLLPALLAVTACTSVPPPETPALSPSRLVRRVIDENRHFSLHCLCQAVTSDTVEAARRRASTDPELIRGLIALLEDDAYSIAAEEILVAVGAQASRVLQDQLDAGTAQHPSRLQSVLRDITARQRAAP